MIYEINEQELKTVFDCLLNCEARKILPAIDILRNLKEVKVQEEIKEEKTKSLKEEKHDKDK